MSSIDDDDDDNEKKWEQWHDTLPQCQIKREKIIKIHDDKKKILRYCVGNTEKNRANIKPWIGKWNHAVATWTPWKR